jgi:hypothetical protein
MEGRGGGVRAYKYPTELEAPKEKAVVNDRGLQRFLSHICCPKQRLETFVATNLFVGE